MIDFFFKLIRIKPDRNGIRKVIEAAALTKCFQCTF